MRFNIFIQTNRSLQTQALEIIGDQLLSKVLESVVLLLELPMKQGLNAESQYAFYCDGKRLDLRHTLSQNDIRNNQVLILNPQENIDTDEGDSAVPVISGNNETTPPPMPTQENKNNNDDWPPVGFKIIDFD